MGKHKKFHENNKKHKEQKEQVSPQEKWVIALLIGMIFFIVSHPLMYQFGDRLTRRINIRLIGSDGKITGIGYAIHLVIFIFIIRILMK